MNIFWIPFSFTKILDLGRYVYCPTISASTTRTIIYSVHTSSSKRGRVQNVYEKRKIDGRLTNTISSLVLGWLHNFTLMLSCYYFVQLTKSWNSVFNISSRHYSPKHYVFSSTTFCLLFYKSHIKASDPIVFFITPI